MSPDKSNLVRYIGDMSREMAKMANTASLDFLAYLLYLVVAEAQSQSNSELTAGPEDRRPN
jgi:roadblock/LC7 domain-containing protein